MERTIRYEPDKTMKKDRWHVTEYSQNIVAVPKKQLHFVHILQTTRLFQRSHCDYLLLYFLFSLCARYELYLYH